MNVTIRNMDEAAFRTLKARAALEGLTLGEAASEAVRLWVRARRSKPGEPLDTKPGSTAAEGASTSPAQLEPGDGGADDWSEFHRTYDRIRAELRAKRAAGPPLDLSKFDGRGLAEGLARLRTKGDKDERLSEQIDEILYGS